MRTLSALITTTWSPESRYGVKLGLSLPINMRATLVASRPNTAFVASTTNQFAPVFRASASAPLATYVLIALSHTFPLETNHNSRVALGRCQRDYRRSFTISALIRFARNRGPSRKPTGRLHVSRPSWSNSADNRGSFHPQ